MKILSSIIMVIIFNQALFAQELAKPESKNDLKKYYQEIDMKAQRLKTVPDDQLVAEILSDCLRARKYDPNIFCLESVVEFFQYFPQTVARVSSKTFSKDEAEFIIRRLNTLNAEALLGNDPSVQ